LPLRARGKTIAFRRSPELLNSLRDAARPAVDPVVSMRGVLWIALAVRKLSEAEELDVSLQRREWPVRLHPRRVAVPAIRDELESAYQLDVARRESLSSLRLAGLLIHCYVFAATDGGIYFTSHVEKQHGLYFLEWAILGQLVQAVCDQGVGSGVIRAA
jgi:hypothetical protein